MAFDASFLLFPLCFFWVGFFGVFSVLVYISCTAKLWINESYYSKKKYVPCEYPLMVYKDANKHFQLRPLLPFEIKASCGLDFHKIQSI